MPKMWFFLLSCVISFRLDRIIKISVLNIWKEQKYKKKILFSYLLQNAHMKDVENKEKKRKREREWEKCCLSCLPIVFVESVKSTHEEWEVIMFNIILLGSVKLREFSRVFHQINTFCVYSVLKSLLWPEQIIHRTKK